MDELLYDISIPAISKLQTTLTDQAPYMQMVSVIFDPKYAFLIYSPIAFLLDQRVGKRLIMTTVIAEWLNMILKWLMHGERPYWYVHSSGHFDAQQTPIKQFPITCELGPGHPSGHAMVTAAVWYIILDAALQLVSNPQQPQPSDQVVTSSSSPQQTATTTGQLPEPVSRISPQTTKLSVWTLYALLLATVSVSRVFLGCHFPHQCMAGALLGFLLARYIARHETRAEHFIVASIVLLATAFGTFGLLQSLGFDPSWTIKLATRHCEKREYIHLDTAPFFSIMRYCGFALGTGLGLAFPLKSWASRLLPMAELPSSKTTTDEAIGTKGQGRLSARNLSWFSFKLLMAMLMARLADNLGLFVSHAYLPTFYSSAYLAYTMFSFAFVNL